MKKLTVVQEPEAPVEKNVLAQAIVDIAAAAKRLSVTGLKEEAVVILLSAKSQYPRKQVRDILQALGQLEKDFCR